MDLKAAQLNNESKDILAVTAEDVQKVWKNSSASNYVAVAVGEGKVIQDQLSVLGLELRPIK
jgi:hypothetical protein